MAIRVERFACKYCNKLFENESHAVRHEYECTVGDIVYEIDGLKIRIHGVEFEDGEIYPSDVEIDFVDGSTNFILRSVSHKRTDFKSFFEEVLISLTYNELIELFGNYADTTKLENIVNCVKHSVY